MTMLCIIVCVKINDIACQWLISDVAISAPFAETGGNQPGTVFIYHSTPFHLLSSEPQQVGYYFSMS